MGLEGQAWFLTIEQSSYPKPSVKKKLPFCAA